MGLDGAGYCVLGVCMLVPRLGEQTRQAPAIAALYPSLFRRFLLEDQDKEAGETGTGTQDPQDLRRGDLAFRLLGYFLLSLGACRLVAAFYWGCGYVYLGLGTCIAEMALVSNELLRHESMLLHRAMGVLLENAVLSLVYMCAAFPHCH
jgi:hypothetical protein